MTSISDLVCKKFNVSISADAPHTEKLQFLVNYLGYEQVKKCIPFTIAQIKNALVKDKHLNNLPLEEWDRAAGLISVGGNVQRVPSMLVNLYRQHGITAYSQSEGVCILKECARMWAEEA